MKVLHWRNYQPLLRRIIEKERECLGVEIRPILKRDGWYKTKSKCWVEIDGRAFETDVEEFDYSLRLLNSIETPLKVIENLENILKQGEKYLTGHQKELVSEYRFFYELRDIGRTYKKIGLKFKRKIRGKNASSK